MELFLIPPTGPKRLNKKTICYLLMTHQKIVTPLSRSLGIGEEPGVRPEYLRTCHNPSRSVLFPEMIDTPIGPGMRGLQLKECR